MNFFHVFAITLLLMLGCSEPKNDKSLILTVDPKATYDLKDSCLKQINIQITELLSNSESIKKHFSLDDNEVALIVNQENKKNLELKKERLIRKLIIHLTDTSDLAINCNFFDIGKVCRGDLALLCIYQVEHFPFAMALRAQWCTGGSISKNIHLPYNWLEYTSYNRNRIKESYLEYFDGKERINYLRDNK